MPPTPPHSAASDALPSSALPTNCAGSGGSSASESPPSAPAGTGGVSLEAKAGEIATVVADKCQAPRKPGQAPDRYATIWQAARLGALEAFASTRPPVDAEDVREQIARIIDQSAFEEGWISASKARSRSKKALAKADTILALASRVSPVDAEVGKLREALEEIAREADEPRKFWSKRIGDIARSALALADRRAK